VERKEKLRLGFPGAEKVVEVTVPDGEPRPWDLDSKLAVVGSAVPRADGPAKVTGRAKYTFDVNLPGMLYGRILRCPYAHARIKKLDASAAEKLPGVKAVVLRMKEGDEPKFQGEEVAALAATTDEIAGEAVRAIQVEWEKLPFVVTLEQAMKEDAPRVHGNRGNVRPGRPTKRGDVEAGFQEAVADGGAVVEATYTTPVQTHSSLETHGHVAHWEGDKLTVWASTQATFGTRQELAQHFRLRANQVQVITHYMGGGFGAKFGAGPEGALCCELARKAGAPVKLMLDRKEEHLAVGNRPSSVQVLKLGAKKDGTITAISAKSHGSPGVAGGAGCNNVDLYEFPNVDKEDRDVALNAGGARAMRAPGRPQGIFALESIADELAGKLGLDPLEFHKKNDRHPVRLAEYDLGAAKIGWERRNKVAGSGAGPKKRGLGMAGSYWPVAGGPPQAAATVQVVIHKDGSVDVRNGCQDIGTGTRTLMSVVAAEELGLPPSQVTPWLGETTDPVGPASGGSTTAPTLAPAVRTAAWRAKQKLFEAAAKELGAEPGGLETSDGMVRVTGQPTKAIPWKKACGLIEGDQLSATGERVQNFGRPFVEQVGGAQFAEVEVDVETGVVRVLKVVAVHDCGRVVNRLTAESQVVGGVIGGIAFALHEERILDPHTGHMVNPNLEFYKIAGSLDMPEIIPIMFDVSNGHNNVGLRGLGEPTIIPTAAAIANAIHNATGARVRDLPMTPDRVLQALAAAPRGEGR
jgi:xanthine dehydrogenase YagR molybdenum-binding subunit